MKHLLLVSSTCHPHFLMLKVAIKRCSHLQPQQESKFIGAGYIFQFSTVQFCWVCVHLFCWLTRVEPDVLSAVEKPSTSSLDLLFILRCFSSHQSIDCSLSVSSNLSDFTFELQHRYITAAKWMVFVFVSILSKNSRDYCEWNDRQFQKHSMSSIMAQSRSLRSQFLRCLAWH